MLLTFCICGEMYVNVAHFLFLLSCGAGCSVLCSIWCLSLCITEGGKPFCWKICRIVAHSFFVVMLWVVGWAFFLCDICRPPVCVHWGGWNTYDTSDTIIPSRHTLYTYYRTNMNTAQWTVLWTYSNPWITQAYYYPTSNTISNPSTKQDDSFWSRAQAKPTPVPNGHKSPTPASHMSRSVVLQTA